MSPKFKRCHVKHLKGYFIRYENASKSRKEKKDVSINTSRTRILYTVIFIEMRRRYLGFYGVIKHLNVLIVRENSVKDIDSPNRLF